MGNPHFKSPVKQPSRKRLRLNVTISEATLERCASVATASGSTNFSLTVEDILTAGLAALGGCKILGSSPGGGGRDAGSESPGFSRESDSAA